MLVNNKKYNSKKQHIAIKDAAKSSWLNQTQVLVIILTPLLLIQLGCKKLIEIPTPTNSITTTTAFSSVANANSTLAGMYTDLSLGTSPAGFANGGATFLAGQSADELLTYGSISPYQINNILPTDGGVSSQIWGTAYHDVFLANSIIDGVQASSLPVDTKNQLIGEAKFIRALSYFYLVNFYGDVPLTTSSNYVKNALLARTSSVQVYQQIISDLQDAQNLLTSDYTFAGGNRVRANKWAATALLARVYLYQKDYNNAAIQSNAVIANTGLFNLVSDLTTVFAANNQEAIFQLIPVYALNFSYATNEGYIFNRPFGSRSTVPRYTITNSLANAFEAGDKRYTKWVASTALNTSIPLSYYPHKYQVKDAQSANSISEYTTVLRLGEQYLIRAEAEANGAGGGLPAAIADLNIIRARAGLAPLAVNLSQAQVMDAVVQERRVELFAEWGHRWFDLKRWGTATAVLSDNKGFAVSQGALLYPIPASELQTDPNLTQNSGY